MNRTMSLVLRVGTLALLLALSTISRANDATTAEPLPAPAPSVVVPGQPVPAPVAKPCVCIEYRHHGRPICCCDCNAPAEIKMVLVVKDPRDCCCEVEVPVCLPGCCTGTPCVDSRCRVLGRATVTYEFECGVRVTVLFRARGDIVVTYLHA